MQQLHEKKVFCAVAVLTARAKISMGFGEVSTESMATILSRFFVFRGAIPIESCIHTFQAVPPSLWVYHILVRFPITASLQVHFTIIHATGRAMVDFCQPEPGDQRQLPVVIGYR